MNRGGVWFLVVLLLFCFGKVTSAEASRLVLLKDERYAVHENVQILEDEAGNLTIDDVSSAEFSDSFQLHDKGVPSFGYSETVYWVRFELDNHSNKEEYLLEFPYAPHDSISLYEPTMDGYQVYVGGDLLPFHKRERNHRFITFDITIPEKEASTYYVRFESEGSLQLQILLWDRVAFSEKLVMEYILLGLYCGITLAMVIYNLFLYSSLRLRSYLWYVIFIIGISMTQLALNGVTYQFIWPESPWWNNRSIVFSLAVSNAAGALFVNKFLDLRGFLPRWSRFIHLLAILNFVIIGILMFHYPLALALVMVFTLFGIITLLTITMWCLLKGNIAARFLFLGWFIFLLSGLLTAMSDAGMLPVNQVTSYSTMFGSVIEMVVFSLALADKMKMLQKEKEKVEQAALKNKEMALKKLQKMDELKDEFLANTTHELKTPLYGIIGIAESLRDGLAGEPNPILKYNLSLIVTSGQRLSYLLNDLLDYSKLKNNEITLEKGPVRLQDAANVVMMIIEPLTKNKELQLFNKIPNDFPYVLADENRIQQILYNLIGNAVKYTDVGNVTITADRKHDIVTVHITDTGVGMSDEDMEIAFNKFEQGTFGKMRKPGGTGLGLSITKDLVELHGGEITLSSELGKGTTVSFTVPTYQESVDHEWEMIPFYQNEMISVENTSSYKEGGGINGKILIADDDPINIQVLSNHLHLEGYQVVVARDGKEVLTRIEAEADFDLVILDLMMPKLTGYDVCKEIRKDYPFTSLPILILTAQSQLKDVVTAFQAGANDYLTKPYFKEELLARVRTLLLLKKVMEEVLEKSQELIELNEELFILNEQLEERVHERTKELEMKTGELIGIEESRRHFLSNISHDLKTPLTAIQGYVSAMMDGILDGNDQKYLQIIYEKIIYIDRLIRDIHDLSNLEAGEVRFYKEWVSVPEFIEHFLGGFEADVVVYPIQFKLESSINPSDEHKLLIDYDRLRQVMENLISNAIKYIAEDGIITIEIMDVEKLSETSRMKYEDTLEAAITIDKGLSPVSTLVIAVHDNGKGIEQEFLSLIFERYYRGDSANYKSHRNTGLGLTIAKEIIHYHDGNIWAESTLNKGSSFYFTLPVYLLKDE